MKKLKLFSKVVMGALLPLCLIPSCTSSPVVVRPNSALTLDCETPLIRGSTWRDVAILAVEQAAALEECTARMRRIRGK